MIYRYNVSWSVVTNYKWFSTSRLERESGIVHHVETRDRTRSAKGLTVRGD